MKKKVFAIILVAVLAVCLFGCGEKEIISAYDIAVQNGFQGSEAEWLDSLRGADGKNGIDGVDGKDGSNGIDGEDGESFFTLEEAFEAAKANGFSGDFIAFCKEFLSGESGEYAAVNDAMRSSVIVEAGVSVEQDGEIVSAGSSAGGGVIYKLDRETGTAYIITNFHIVYSADGAGDGFSDDIGIFLYDGSYAGMLAASKSSFALLGYKKIPAELVGASAYYDLAVLRASGEDLKSEFVKSAEFSKGDPAVGQSAYAIGFPNGQGMSVTRGIVSVDSENIAVMVDERNTYSLRVLRMDVPVNSGNSGGGLFDSDGRLLGIVNARSGRSDTDDFGFAIPADCVGAVAENIIANCNGNDKGLKRPMLGITTGATGAKAIYDENSGKVRVEETVTIIEVSETSICKDLLAANDIIISASVGDRNITVDRNYRLSEFMLTVRAGETLNLTVMRNGEETTVSVVIPPDCFIDYLKM